MHGHLNVKSEDVKVKWNVFGKEYGTKEVNSESILYIRKNVWNLMIITSLQLFSGPNAVSNKKYKCWAHEDKVTRDRHKSEWNIFTLLLTWRLDWHETCKLYLEK